MSLHPKLKAAGTVQGPQTQKVADYLLAVQKAWMAKDWQLSTALNRRFVGVETSFVSEHALLPNDLPKEVHLSKVSLNQKDVGILASFDQALIQLDMGLPILTDGRALRPSFRFTQSIETYLGLYTTEGSAALKKLANSQPQFENCHVSHFSNIYYHFLIDTLPHLVALGRNNEHRAPRLLHKSNLMGKAWQKDVLTHFFDIFGAQAPELVSTDQPIAHVKDMHIMTPSPLKLRLELLKQLVVDGGDLSAAPYLYCQRSPSDHRRMENEAAVLERLGSKFTVIQPDQLDFVTQIKLLSKAKCVVGVHGSNLANIVFSQPHTAIVEMSAGLPQPFYENLARANGMPYRRVEGIYSREEGDNRPDFMLDFIVNPDDVVAAIDAILP